MSARETPPQGTVAGLADAVKALRAELSDAMVAGQGELLQFEVGTVTMAFAVEITADAEAKGGVRFWVVELGSAGRLGRHMTHTVTLEMTPKTSTGQSPLIADADG